MCKIMFRLYFKYDGIVSEWIIESLIVCLFAECVTKAVSDADRKKISVLEKNQADLKHEVSKLKVLNILPT